MKITIDDLRQVAALANLEVPEGEAETLAEQLSRIVDYAEKLNELDTDAVAPTTQVVRGSSHAERTDRIEPRTGSGDAADRVGLFSVPRVITPR